jgi:hypothetical protein
MRRLGWICAADQQTLDLGELQAREANYSDIAAQTNKLFDIVYII